MPEVIHLGFPFSAYAQQLNSGVLSIEHSSRLNETLEELPGESIHIFGVNHNTGKTIKETISKPISGFIDSYTLSNVGKKSLRFETVVVATSPNNYGDILKFLKNGSVRIKRVILLFEEDQAKEKKQLNNISFKELSDKVVFRKFGVPIYRFENAILCPDGSVFIEHKKSWRIIHQTQALNTIKAGYAAQICNGKFIPDDTDIFSFVGPWKDHIWGFLMRDLPVAFIGGNMGWNGEMVTCHKPEFTLEAMNLLGLHSSPERRIVSPTRFKSLYVADHSAFFRHDYSITNRDLFLAYRQSIISSLVQKPPSKRTYIHRSWRRKVINEEEMLQVLTRHNMVPVKMENETLTSQIKITANSVVLAGTMGAGMVHSSFLPFNAAYIEIYTPNVYKESFFTNNIKFLDLRSHRLEPNSCSNSCGKDWNNDFRVDIDRLNLLLTNVLQVNKLIL